MGGGLGVVWIAASIFAVGIVYLSIHHPPLRKWAGITFGGAIALIACLAVYLWLDGRESERKAELSKKLIQQSQVRISEARLSLEPGGKLEALVTNNSRFRLTSLSLEVLVTDCARVADILKNSKCNIVGEATASDWTINVPPGQKRQFSGYPSFPNLPDLREGEWSWTYRITETRGEPNP